MRKERKLEGFDSQSLTLLEIQNQFLIPALNNLNLPYNPKIEGE